MERPVPGSSPRAAAPRGLSGPGWSRQRAGAPLGGARPTWGQDGTARLLVRDLPAGYLEGGQGRVALIVLREGRDLISRLRTPVGPARPGWNAAYPTGAGAVAVEIDLACRNVSAGVTGTGDRLGRWRPELAVRASNGSTRRESHEAIFSWSGFGSLSRLSSCRSSSVSPSPPAPLMTRSRTAQQMLGQLVSPGKWPITVVRRLTTPGATPSLKSPPVARIEGERMAPWRSPRFGPWRSPPLPAPIRSRRLSAPGRDRRARSQTPRTPV